MRMGFWKRGSPAVPDEKDPISIWQKTAFGMGSIVGASSQGALVKLVYPIYQITYGVNPVVIGAILTLMRVWDAITDPIVGNWSDNCRTRWGRRRPFILVGGLLSSIIFPLIWFAPPGWSEDRLVMYLIATTLLFLTTHTVFNVPYESLGYELTKDYHARTRLYAFRSFFLPLLAVAIEWVYAFIQTDLFSSQEAGLRFFAVIFGLLMLTGTLLPFLLLRERVPKPGEQTRERQRFLVNFKETLQNGPFVMIMTIVVVSTIATQTVSQMGIYLKIYYLYRGDTMAGAVLAGWLSVIYQVCFFGAIPLATWISKFRGKIYVYQAGMLLTLVGSFAKYICYNPDMPYLVLLLPVLLAPAAAINSFILPSILADVCDYDFWKMGRRREGMFAAVGGWINKVAFSLTGTLGGIALVAIGFDEALGGAQSDFTLQWMRIAFAGGPALAAAFALLILFLFPLTPARMEQIRAELDAREEAAEAV
jgi:glycoside/pentoside/hexuronide:cation symporter, GPH family